MERLLTIREVAKLLHKSEKWVRRAVHSGEIPAYRLGIELRFRISDLEAYIEKSVVNP